MVPSSRVQSRAPLLPSLLVVLRMPLLSLALPHSSALPHYRRCAHPRAPIAPGLALLNLHINKPFINNSTMGFDTQPVRACALVTLERPTRAAAAPPPPLRIP